MYWIVKLFGWPFTPHNANLSIQRIHNKHNLMLVKFPRVPVTLAPWYSVHQGNIGTHGTIGTLALLGACQPFHGAVVNLRHCRYFPHILRLAEWQWNSSIVRVRISLRPQVDFQLCMRCICVCISSGNHQAAPVHIISVSRCGIWGQPIALCMLRMRVIVVLWYHFIVVKW